MTHFHRTLVKQSQPRLFSLRHDFSANNTLATLVTFLLSCTLRVRRKFATLAEKIQKYDSTRGNHAIWRFFSPSQFVPGIFVGQQLPVARNVGQPQTSLSPMHSIRPNRQRRRRRRLYVSSKYVRTDGGKCSTKISGIPDTIGSTNPEARKGIHHLASGPVHPNVPSLYFPNNSPLKSNFANISARQLCLLPFRFSVPKGSVHHRNRGRRETFSASAVQTWPRSTTLT